MPELYILNCHQAHHLVREYVEYYNQARPHQGIEQQIGQRQPTDYIRTMVMDETLDATIFKVLVEKANQIRRDYGFSLSVPDMSTVRRRHNEQAPVWYNVINDIDLTLIFCLAIRNHRELTGLPHSLQIRIKPRRRNDEPQTKKSCKNHPSLCFRRNISGPL
jgi:hypothetical protein